MEDFECWVCGSDTYFEWEKITSTSDGNQEVKETSKVCSCCFEPSGETISSTRALVEMTSGGLQSLKPTY